MKNRSRLIELLSLVCASLTAAGLTQQTLPAGAAIDSLSFLPVLQRKPGLHQRNEVVIQSGNANLALRLGDWKSIPNLKIVGRWYADKSPDLVPPGLLNLKEDIGEQHNLVAANTNRLAELREQLRAVQQ